MDLNKIENHFSSNENDKFGRADNGIVVTAFNEATQAGVLMLEQGGNAVDAACAVSLALSVCEPQSSGLGGQGMAILHINGKTIALDGSSRIPSLAHISHFTGQQYSMGYQAATIPSLLALIGYLHMTYGRLDWSQIFGPAIALARYGYRISPLQHYHQKVHLNGFLRSGSDTAARYFLKDGTAPYDVGDLFIQKDLAHLLEIIAEEGPRSFYLGKIAQQIGEDMKANKGFLRSDDLALIPWPIERQPLMRKFRDVEVCTVPPPAAGRTLLLILLMLNGFEPEFISQMTSKSAHVLAETFRRALLLRQQQSIHPAFYNQTQDTTMTSPSFAAELAGSIKQTIDPSLPTTNTRSFGNDTTHFSVMDSEGNAIGISQSIESIYGSKTAAQGLGFLYNNYINTMEIRDPGHPHYLRPNAVPWSSVAPSILFHRGKPWITFGSPGSDRIFSAMAQFIVRVVDGKCSLAQAVDSPRIHCSMGGVISLEADRFDPSVIAYLENMGYTIDRRSPRSFFLGAIYGAMKCQTKNEFQGIAEIRREGSVAGPA